MKQGKEEISCVLLLVFLSLAFACSGEITSHTKNDCRRVELIAPVEMRLPSPHFHCFCLRLCFSFPSEILSR